MQDFLQWHIPVRVRRLITIAPSLLVIALGLDPTRTLVMSQVILSFGLPFAIVPLVLFTRNQAIMGPLVNRKTITILSGMIASLIIALNVYLLHQLLFAG